MLTTMIEIGDATVEGICRNQIELEFLQNFNSKSYVPNGCAIVGIATSAMKINSLTSIIRYSRTANRNSKLIFQFLISVPFRSFLIYSD